MRREAQVREGIEAIQILSAWSDPVTMLKPASGLEVCIALKKVKWSKLYIHAMVGFD
jgi:hypothetical protein